MTGSPRRRWRTESARGISSAMAGVASNGHAAVRTRASESNATRASGISTIYPGKRALASTKRGVSEVEERL
jgi:hypothetical protein